MNQNLLMKYEYFDSIDLINIEFEEEYDYRDTIELEYGVNLDFDKKHLPVNLEIDSASKYLDIDKEFLKKPRVRVEINIDRNIEVEIIFIFKNNEKRTITYDITPDLYIHPSQNLFVY